MKSNNRTRFTYFRPRISSLLKTLPMIGAALLTGCNDDLPNPNGNPANGSIGFKATLSSGWHPTRADQCDRPYVSNIHGGEAIADSLFLNMTATQGIMSGNYDLHDPEGLEYSVNRKGEGMVTRGTPITPNNGTMYSEFGVSAYTYKGEWDEAMATPDYFYNLKASKVSDGIYALKDNYFWPGPSYKMKFFAVAPYLNPNYIVSGEERKGSPKVSVTIPASVAEQQDLVVATTGELDGNKRTDVDLNFQHPLTAVRFVAGDDMTSCTVNSITLSNVFYKGELNLGNPANGWTIGTEKRNFTQNLGKVMTDAGNGNTGEGNDITGAAQTFMMLPQTLPENATITMVLTAGGKSYTISASIGGQTWSAGSTVTYQLSTTSINWTYTLEANLIKNPTTQVDGRISVTSYRTHLTGRREEVPYSTTYSIDSENKFSTFIPEYLTIDPIESLGYIDTYKVGLLDFDSIQLQRNEVVGQVLPYNLSNFNGEPEIENTANCYIIKSAGKYRLPLVWGNMIKNRAINSNAYKATVSGNNVMSTLYTAWPINGPFIKDTYTDNENPNWLNGCKLIYQTTKGLVSNLKIDNNKEFIEFEIDRSSIKPGNALIAVTYGDDVVWSWHLWFTSLDTKATVTINDRKVMCMGLGQTGQNLNKNIRNKVVTYQIKFSNNITEKTIEIPYDNPPMGPHYLWGRKDPMAVATRTDTKSETKWVTAYDINGQPAVTCEKRRMGSGVSYIANCQKYPIALPISTDKYSNPLPYVNLWNNGNNELSEIQYQPNKHPSNFIKTIYDPSPQGFHVLSQLTSASFGKFNCATSLTKYGCYTNDFWFVTLGRFCHTDNVTPSSNISFLYNNYDYGTQAFIFFDRPKTLSSGIVGAILVYSQYISNYQLYYHEGGQVYCEEEVQ